MCFGGLLRAKALLALPVALENPDTELRWLDLPIVTPSTGSRPSLYRWLPDPLTRLLLITRQSGGLPPRPTLSGKTTRYLFRLIKCYAEHAGFAEHLPPHFTALSQAAQTRLHLHLPPYLVHYLVGRRESSSLPPDVWDRLIHPPTEISEFPRTSSNQSGTAAESISSNAEAQSDKASWPAQLRQLASIVRKQGSPSDRQQRIIEWRITCANDLLLSVSRLGEWVEKWLSTKGRNRRPLQPRSVYAMLNAIGGRLAGQLGNRDPAALNDVAAYIELYQTALEDCPSLGVRRRVARSLKSFHKFLEKMHDAPRLSDDGLFAVYGKGKGTVDANFIGTDTFFRARQWLYHDTAQRYDANTANALCRIMALGYFAGLRRSEAVGLEVDDLEGNTHVDLLVRPNALRQLKSRSARRIIPVSMLMPPEELRRLLEWRDKRQAEIERSTTEQQLLFYIDTLGRAPTDTDPLMAMITDALQKATGQKEFRYHHLRHSFANWLLLKFWHAEQSKENDPWPEWLLNTAHDNNRLDIALRERQHLLGKSTTNSRSLMQISRLLGHSSADITLTHYLHLLDLIASRELRALTPHLATKTLSKLTGYSKSHIKRLRNTTNSALDNNALDLETIIKKLQIKRRLNTPPKTVPKTKAATLPRLSPPTTPFEKHVRLAKAVDTLMLAPNELQPTIEHLALDAVLVQEAVSRFKELPINIGRIDLRTPKQRGIDTPQGPKQILLAKHAATTFQRLHSDGIAGEQRQTTRKRLMETLDTFINHWLPGNGLSVQLKSLPDTKKWLWLLLNLELDEAVSVRHHPSQRSDARPMQEQSHYWKERLKRTLIEEEPSTRHNNRRGIVTIELDASKIPSTIVEAHQQRILFGLRFVLLMSWLSRMK